MDKDIRTVIPIKQPHSEHDTVILTKRKRNPSKRVVHGAGRDVRLFRDDGPGLALGGEMGLDVGVERQLAFIVEADISGHRLSSDPIDACAPGAGAATNLGARIGFLYRFDLDPSGPRSNASAQPR